jgi:hypothetical protein
MITNLFLGVLGIYFLLGVPLAVSRIVKDLDEPKMSRNKL